MAPLRRLPGPARVSRAACRSATGADYHLLKQDQQAIDARIGSAIGRLKNNATLIIEGILIGGNPLADRAIALARGGGLSLSVGARPTRNESLRAGATAFINGKAVRGPLTIARESELIEVSAVGIGADANAVAVAASKQKEDITMATEIDPTLVERARISEIRAAFCGIAGGEERISALVEDGASADEAREMALTMLRAQRPAAPVVMSPRDDGLADDVQAAAMIFALAGQAVAERNFTANVCEQAADLHRREPSFIGKVETAMRAAGEVVPRERTTMIRAAFSTSALSGLLSSSIRTIALDAFRTSNEPWRRIAKRVSLSDFKATDVARLAGNFAFVDIAAGGELKHATLDGKFTTMRLGTTGKIVTIDRRDVLNDTAGLLAEIPNQLGREAARRVGDDFAAALVAGDSGSGGFFSAESANLVGAALDFASLSAAVAKLRTQTDESGRVLNLTPAILLVAADIEMSARQLINSSDVGRTDNEPSGNPLRNIAAVEVDGRMAAGNWYLFSPASDAAAIVGTLDGGDAPTVEAVDPGIEVLGLGWRGYFDHAVVLHESRAAVQGHAGVV